jgi:nucleoside-diphosphate-sugar epimerase
MDGQDMAQWLLRIIDAGSSSDIYHVGSERAVSIRDLATLVGERYQSLTETSVKINVLGQTSPLDGVSRYVPSTDFTQRTLGVRETITLEDSIDRMISVGLRSL